MADQEGKAGVKAPEHVSIHNRGIRTYHIPARALKAGEAMGKDLRLELPPGGTVDVPAEVAKELLGPNGYRDLVDAAKMAPAQAKKLADLQAENELLKAKLAAGEKPEAEKPGKDDKPQKGK